MSSNRNFTTESLSQGEIDLLFSAGGDEPPPAERLHRGPDVQIYDFRRPARISKDRKRSLEVIYGLLAKSVEGWLSGRIRDAISLELQSVEELTYGEFQLALPSPCASFILDVKGTEGQQGVIDFGHEFAYFIIDRLLGGSGETVVMERSLTPTERLLVRIVADRIAIQLSEVWQDHLEMDLSISGFETIPEMLHVANREDPVLVANLDVTIGDMSSPLLLCLPFAILEKFFTTAVGRKAQITQGTPEERNEELESLEGALRSARIPVHARFEGTRVSIRELASLKEGSILNTNLATNTELFVYIAGQKRFSGVPGRVSKKLATRLMEALELEPLDLIEPGRERI